MLMIRTSRIFISRVTAPSLISHQFSSECEAAQKLRDILSEYRRVNYSRELPTRFKKEILQPYASNDGSVNVEQLNLLLTNIGHSQHCLTPSEQQELLREAGSSDRSITVKKMMELID